MVRRTSIAMIALFLLGCGAKVTVNNPTVKVEGEVRHVVDINWENLRNEIEKSCRTHLGVGATQSEIDSCVNEVILSIVRLL